MSGEQAQRLGRKPSVWGENRVRKKWAVLDSNQ